MDMVCDTMKYVDCLSHFIFMMCAGWTTLMTFVWVWKALALADTVTDKTPYKVLNLAGLL